jgi:hypothetical protein
MKAKEKKFHNDAIVGLQKIKAGEMDVLRSFGKGDILFKLYPFIAYSKETTVKAIDEYIRQHEESLKKG